MPAIPQVKNRAPAPIQITAEQLLREAKERKLEDVGKAPKQFITDKEELLEYQRSKRQDFENQIRRQRQLIGNWCKYGLWEASQKEFENARSVFERALDVDYRDQTIWFKYIEMELKNKFINHARNLLDRCIAIHPRVDKFWFKYTYVEEMIGAIEQARQVFERWMKWEPDDMGWAAYIKFEMRQNEIQRARNIYERYCFCHPTSRAYLKYAKWEESLYEKALVRKVYERSLEEIHPDEGTVKLLINFARFEERCKEFERCRVIYKYAIDQATTDAHNTTTGTLALLSEDERNELNQELIGFEKRHGNRNDVDNAIVQNRRKYYNELVSQDKYNYDAWFDYTWLEEKELQQNNTNATTTTIDNTSNYAMARSVYERAIQNIPPILEKRYWKRYIYLYINYALFEELECHDILRAREVYKQCLNIIPHHLFTFGKIWLYASQLEIRQKDLTSARKILGKAIGICPKESLFKKYIEMELQLGEIDRCRTIYSKYLEYMPYNCNAWKAFTQLEMNVGESSRVRAIFEIALRQNELDMPEMLWKAYIDFENNEGCIDHVRTLYSRLLERTSHVKVWISYGKFESAEAVAAANEQHIIDTTTATSTTTTSSSNNNKTSSSSSSVISKVGVNGKESLKLMRQVFKQGYDLLKSQDLKEDRLLLLQAWRECESDAVTHGLATESDTAAVEAMMPKKVKMRRMAVNEQNVELGWEEYYDYIFPDDEKKIGSLKILEKALLWKQAMANASGGGADTSNTTTGVVTDTAEVNIDDDDGGGGGKEIVSSSNSSISGSSLGKRSYQESSLSAAAAPDDEDAIDIDDI